MPMTAPRPEDTSKLADESLSLSLSDLLLALQQAQINAQDDQKLGELLQFVQETSEKLDSDGVSKQLSASAIAGFRKRIGDLADTIDRAAPTIEPGHNPPDNFYGALDTIRQLMEDLRKAYGLVSQ